MATLTPQEEGGRGQPTGKANASRQTVSVLGCLDSPGILGSWRCGRKARSPAPGLTEPRLRRVLMLCFPLSPSSSSLTGLNIKGGGSTGFSMGGSSPYFLKWMRQSVQSRMFSRPPWCQSLEAA